MDPCNLCGSTGFKPLANRLRDDFSRRVVACSRCSHVQLQPLPTEHEIASYYDDPTHSFGPSLGTALTEKRNALLKETLRHADYITSLLKPGSTILDFGCGYGWFLAEMAARGFRAIGVEPSRVRRVAAESLPGVTILSSVLDLPKTTNAHAVNLFFVLEHLRSPVDSLKMLAPYLISDGDVVAVVPNIHDHLLTHNEAYRQFYWKRAHISYFSEKTLRECFDRAGYVCKEVIYLQRWNLANGVHWMLNNEPQSRESVLRAATMHSFEWLNSIYENHLSAERVTDTLLLRARKMS